MSGSLPQAARTAGAVLVTALVLLLVVLMIGAATGRAAGNAEKSSRAERDRRVAFVAAEAALDDGERDIESTVAPGRAALFAGGSTGLASGCGRGVDDHGLCQAGGPGTAAWVGTDLADDAAVTVAYGSFSGAQMPTAIASLPARVPRYLIEFMPGAGAVPANGSVYRVTAIGFGAHDSTRVVLQSYHRKAAPGVAPVPSLPSGRIAWREVPNWPEQHQAALK
jgi:Tfp pilus assembly protein PilX